MYHSIKHWLQTLFMFGTILLFLSNCTKEYESPDIPAQPECWQINNWIGLLSDSMLNIDMIPEVPAVDREYVDWLNKKDNHILIRSLVSENYDDLKCFDQYISSVKIIQLGESNHGSKEYNLIKVRLVKYLHEVHGFNVIAFESGFFDCSYANNRINGITITEAINTSIFGIWQTEEVLDLFHFIKFNTDYKLNLAGIDCQDLLYNNNKLNRALLLKELVSFIDPGFAEEVYFNDIEITHFMDLQDSIQVNRDVYKSKINNSIGFIESNLSAIQDSLKENGHLALMAIQSLKNTIAYIDVVYYIACCNDDIKGFAIRDSAMAANVVFLSETLYPDEKIIIWAHDAHIAYDMDHYTIMWYNGAKVMGSWLHDFYQNDVYTIGLYALRGEFGFAGQTWSLELPSSPSSLEAICYHANKKYMFFDINPT